MAFLLGFFVGPVIDKVGKVITNTGGMMFGDKERETRFNNIVERLKNLNMAIEAKVIQAHKKKHKEKSIFSKPIMEDDDGDGDGNDDNPYKNNDTSRKQIDKKGEGGKCDIQNDGLDVSIDNSPNRNGISKKKEEKTTTTTKGSILSMGMAAKLKFFGKKMHDKLKTLPSEDVRNLSKFEDNNDTDVHYGWIPSPGKSRKRSISRTEVDGEGIVDDIFNDTYEDDICCDFLNPCYTFMRDNCEFLGCIEETTREVVVNVDTMGKEWRDNVEKMRTTVAGTGISDFNDPILFPDICPMFTNFDKKHHGDIQEFAHDLKVWFYADKNEGLSKLGKDYHMDLMTFDERLEKIETAYEIKFASDNQRNMNIIKSKLDKIESMLQENHRNWTITKRYYINVFTVLFVFHIIFHLMVHGEVDINPFNDIEALQKLLRPSHR